MSAGTLALLLLAAGPLAAQDLSLADAFRRADRGAYANRIAAGQARESAARADAALRGILPTARLEAGWMRTTDPVAVFGIQLRQRTITQADFTPATLNDPAARSDVSTGTVLEVPILNPDAWLGRSAAGRAGDAAEASARWTRERTRADVARAYFGARLAAERVTTLEAALRAARDHVRQAEAMAQNGLVTRSDALLASVKAGEIEADLAGARADAILARRGLAVLLGLPADTVLALPAVLPVADRVRALAALPDGAAGERADLQAARLGLSAANADRDRARSLLLPRINAFARYDWHAPGAVFGGDPMWTVGVMGSWTPFNGGTDLSERRQADGRLAAARAAAEAAEAQAALERQRRDSDLEVALMRLDIADRAVTQAAEAHRIVSRKYDGGLATVVELLDASATETAARLRQAAARHAVIGAVADRRHARALDLAVLTTLDQ